MRFIRCSRRRRADPLWTCPSCRSGFACPTAWEPSDDAHWHIDLRCGECEHRWETVIEDGRAARYDVELDDQLAAMNRTLRCLDLDRMAVEVEAFATAITRDLIEPADFQG